MKGNNLVILFGNLGGDPELKSLPNGSRVATLSLATNTYWRTKDGERRERTDWHRIKVWDRQADFCERYLRRGDTVHVVGALRAESIDQPDGNRKRFVWVRAQDVQSIRRGQAPRTEPAAPGPAPPQPVVPRRPAASGAAREVDALPF